MTMTNTNNNGYTVYFKLDGILHIEYVSFSTLGIDKKHNVREYLHEKYNSYEFIFLGIKN